MNRFAMATALGGALAAALGASPNLLDNSGFEFNARRGRNPDGWTTHVPVGGVCETDPGMARSGAVGLRLQVPEGAALDWYQANRSAQPIKRGATYILSAWVKTENARQGAGAYISINCFDGNGKRLGCFDSPGRQTGTADWKCLSASGAVPDGTSEMRVILCLHGCGTAWFDDVQIEEGTAPTPYQPSPADADREAAMQEDARVAATWVQDLPPRVAGQARIGVLDLFGAGRPSPDPAATACPSDPAVLVEAFRAAGQVAFVLPPERVTNPSFLDPANIDVLVVPSGDLFPAAAHRALVEYLRCGGALLSMGGYAFDRPAIRLDGTWYDPAALPIPAAPLTPAFAAGTDGWTPSSNRKEMPAVEAVVGPQGLAGLELTTPSLEGWDTMLSPPVDGRLPAGWSIVRFRARGDAKTPRAWIEWNETDGSRWHKAIDLTAEWQEYALTPTDFGYWHDNPSVGRGGSTDRFRPAQASRFQFGVATDIVDRGQPHRVSVVGVSVQADPLAHLRLPAPHINTRWARIRDAMWPEPEQIGVFDPGFPLRDVTRTRPAPGQAVVADFDLTAPLTGYSATAMLGLNGHGFGPNRARWVPLLECLDRFDRARGHAGAIVHHFSGTFTGSSWAVFGVSSRDLFASGSPALQQVLMPVTEALLRRLYLHETETAYACYRRGESIVLRTRVSNFGPTPQAAEVRFVLGPDGAAPTATLTRPVSPKPGETVDVEATWTPPEPAADLYRLTAELWTGDRRLDLEETAVVVWSPEVLAKGPVLKKDGTRFLLDGTPQFLMGCQTYWGQNGSVTARSPLAFDRDFRQLRDFGLRWTRCFIPFKSEADKRISDAIVQRAQKHGIVLYHTPNLYNTADPAELARQVATAREIAERYRDVPGLAVDICNEPAFNADDTALQKEFGRPGRTTGEWQDSEVTAFWWSMANAQRTWAKANRLAIHEADGDRLASVGWSQGWAGGESMKDPLLASLDLDFTDRHYYGRPAGLAAELKDVDLRWLGKPLVLGECGAKDHPTFRAADPWGMGDDDASYDQRFLYLAHHALGLGAAVMSSWHWRDPMEGIFPCGLVHPTNAPRPTARLYRAMALAFSQFRPVNATPDVCLLLPDAGRQSGQRDAAIRAFHRASDLLMAARVDFGLLPDSVARAIPTAKGKALFYPLPLDPPDPTVEFLAQFAQAGGTVYLSGDLSYDGKRQPTKRQRLASLCGVEAEGDALAAPLSLPPAAGTLVPATGSGLAAGESRPFLRLRLAGAEALATCNGAPVVTRFRLGQGQVWFCTDPVELAGEMAVSHLALYRAVLAAAGVPRFEASPESPDLHVFRRPGEQGDAWLFHNRGAALEAKVGDWTIGLAAGGSGFLLLGQDGGPRAAECQGALRRGADEVLRISNHAFVIAEDDRDLAQSAQLLVLPLAPGEVRVVTARTTAPTAEVGETRDGKWTALATVPVHLEGGQAVLRVAPADAREMIRLHW